MTTCAPMRTASPSWTPSPRTRPGARSDGRILLSARLVERGLQAFQNADHPQTRPAVRARRATVAHAAHEVLALQAQRLAVADRRAPDVAGAGDVLAVGARALVEALVVDGDLALDVHVVERRHPLGADHGEAALLVRVQPRQVQVRGEPGREA